VNDLCIRVFYSSRTVGTSSDRMGFMHACHSCEERLGLKKKDQSGTHLVPPEVMPVIFSAKSAAKEVGVECEIIDINQLSRRERLTHLLSGKPLPRVSISDSFLTGIPTKQEIISLYESYRRL